MVASMITFACLDDIPNHMLNGVWLHNEKHDQFCPSTMELVLCNGLCTSDHILSDPVCLVRSEERESQHLFREAAKEHCM